MTSELTGHTDADTAYVVDDYPYGFRLRTQIRYWIETKNGHGQRMVSQTLNPKTGRWNKPKPSTYSTVRTLMLEDNGHVESRGLGTWATEEQIAAFEQECPEAAASPFEREAIRYLRAANRVNDKITVTIHECKADCTEHHQTLQEQSKMLNGAIRHELWQDTRAAIRGEYR